MADATNEDVLQWLKEAIVLLRRLEFSCDSNERTGADTADCPMCGRAQIHGLDGLHASDCELGSFLDRFKEMHI